VQRAHRSRAAKVGLRKYSRMPAGLNLTEGFGIDPEGVPETIIIPGIAGEYATNFFRESYKRGGARVAQAFELELNILTWSVRGDSDWDVITTSPFFSLEVKEKTVRDKCKDLKLSPFFTNRVIALLQSDIDITRLEQIRTDFEELMRSFRRERQVVLVTGKDLSKEETEFFKHSLRVSYLSEGDSMVFTHQVDSNIKGGLRVVIDGTIHDHSWTEKTLSDTRAEGEAEGNNQKRRAPVAIEIDPDIMNNVSKYLVAAFPKEKVHEMNSLLQVKKA